ncbi:YhbY family RNA-binding protein [Candidatus Pacearchaeota archaeon]|nr:YhbY family RNA-binding protein [Candidatus Pacearchaeota archaeon]
MVKPVRKLQMGKNGLSEAFIGQVQSILDNERLVKISILKSHCRDKAEAKEIAEKLIETLGKKYDYKLIGYVMTIIKYRKDQR